MQEQGLVFYRTEQQDGDQGEIGISMTDTGPQLLPFLEAAHDSLHCEGNARMATRPHAFKAQSQIRVRYGKAAPRVFDP